MVAPCAAVQEPRREIGTVIFIPVTNPIESVFATVRHRTVRTKGALSAKTAKLMVFKLVNGTAKTWRRLKRENQLPKVVQGAKFQNGIEVIKTPAHHAA
jgi:putative transposase